MRTYKQPNGDIVHVQDSDLEDFLQYNKQAKAVQDPAYVPPQMFLVNGQETEVAHEDINDLLQYNPTAMPLGKIKPEIKPIVQKYQLMENEIPILREKINATDPTDTATLTKLRIRLNEVDASLQPVNQNDPTIRQTYQQIANEVEKNRVVKTIQEKNKQIEEMGKADYQAYDPDTYSSMLANRDNLARYYKALDTGMTEAQRSATELGEQIGKIPVVGELAALGAGGIDLIANNMFSAASQEESSRVSKGFTQGVIQAQYFDNKVLDYIDKSIKGALFSAPAMLTMASGNPAGLVPMAGQMASGEISDTVDKGFWNQSDFIAAGIKTAFQSGIELYSDAAQLKIMGLLKTQTPDIIKKSLQKQISATLYGKMKDLGVSVFESGMIEGIENSAQYLSDTAVDVALGKAKPPAFDKALIETIDQFGQGFIGGAFLTGIGGGAVAYSKNKTWSELDKMLTNPDLSAPEKQLASETLSIRNDIENGYYDKAKEKLQAIADNPELSKVRNNKINMGLALVREASAIAPDHIVNKYPATPTEQPAQPLENEQKQPSPEAKAPDTTTDTAQVAEVPEDITPEEQILLDKAGEITTKLQTLQDEGAPNEQIDAAISELQGVREQIKGLAETQGATNAEGKPVKTTTETKVKRTPKTTSPSDDELKIYQQWINNNAYDAVSPMKDGTSRADKFYEDNKKSIDNYRAYYKLNNKDEKKNIDDAIADEKYKIEYFESDGWKFTNNLSDKARANRIQKHLDELHDAKNNGALNVVYTNRTYGNRIVPIDKAIADDEKYLKEYQPKQAQPDPLSEVKRIASLFGIKVRVDDLLPSAEALYINGDIVYNSKRLKSVDKLRVFGHEFTHNLATAHPELYHALLSTVKFSEQEITNKQAEYKKAGITLTKTGAVEELLAVKMGEALKDGKLFESIASKDKTLFDKIVQALKEFVATLKGEGRTEFEKALPKILKDAVTDANAIKIDEVERYSISPDRTRQVLLEDGQGKQIVYDSGEYRIAVNNPKDATYVTLWKDIKDKWSRIGALTAGKNPIGYKDHLNIGQIEIDKKYRGQGLGKKMYKALIDFSAPEIKGIVSYLPNRYNKKQVPRIYKDFGSKIENDYDIIDFEETKYSLSTPEAELSAIRKQYENTPQWLKAPNGKATNLNERQWLQVRTPSFLRWFGDWENDPKNASKVVDENGEPMVVYHGTGGDVFEPITEFAQNHDMNMPIGYKKEASFFAKESDVASDYAMSAEYTGYSLDGMGANVYPVFLNIRNITEIDAKGKGGNGRGGALEKAFSQSQKENSDGFVVKNVKDSPEYIFNEKNTGDYPFADRDLGQIKSKIQTNYAVFSPTQIKSATANIGTFDPNNADIRYSLAPKTKAGRISQIDEAIAQIKAAQSSPKVLANQVATAFLNSNGKPNADLQEKAERKFQSTIREYDDKLTEVMQAGTLIDMPNYAQTRNPVDQTDTTFHLDQLFQYAQDLGIKEQDFEQIRNDQYKKKFVTDGLNLKFNAEARAEVAYQLKKQYDEQKAKGITDENLAEEFNLALVDMIEAQTLYDEYKSQAGLFLRSSREQAGQRAVAFSKQVADIIEVSQQDMEEMRKLKQEIEKLKKELEDAKSGTANQAEIDKLKRQIEGMKGRLQTKIKSLKPDRPIIDIDTAKIDNREDVKAKVKASWYDTLMAIFYGNILSGPATHFRNVIPNQINTLLEQVISTILQPKNVKGQYESLGKGLKIGVKEAGKTFKGQTSSHQKFDLNAPGTKNRLIKIYDIVTKALAAEDAFSTETNRMPVINSLAYELANGDKKLYNMLVQLPSANMLKQAEWESKKTVVNQNPEWVIGEIATTLMKFISHIESLNKPMGAALRTTVPFIRVAANLWNLGLDYTPLGAVRAFAYKRNSQWVRKQSKLWADNKSPFAMRDYKRQMVKAALGTTLLAAVALTMQGAISGSGPRDKKKKDELMLTGWRPWSMKVGDAWISYKLLGAFALGLGFIGEYFDYKEYAEQDTDSEDKAIFYSLIGFSKLMLDQGFLSGFTQMQNIVNNRAIGMAEQRTAGQIAAFTPFLGANLFKQLEQIWDTAHKTEQIHKPETLAQYMIMAYSPWSRILGLQKDVAHAKDIFGQDMRRNAGYSYYLGFPASKEEEYLINSYDMLPILKGLHGLKIYLPGTASAKVNINDYDYQLKGKDLENYRNIKGRELSLFMIDNYDDIIQMIEDKDREGLDSLLGKLNGAATKQAKQEIMDNYKLKDKYKWSKQEQIFK
jgi:ribosomal protein S18 acetylase RimI-like enzyme